MTADGDIRILVELGAVPRPLLGVLLNVVAKPRFPCPTCGARRPMEVFVPAVRWGCGHTRSLPPLNLDTARARRAVAKLIGFRDEISGAA